MMSYTLALVSPVRKIGRAHGEALSFLLLPTVATGAVSFSFFRHLSEAL